MSNWQQHLPVLPVLLPLCAGAILLFPGETRRGLRAAIALGATLLQLVVAIVLLAMTDGHTSAPWNGEIGVYALGTWPPPSASCSWWTGCRPSC